MQGWARKEIGITTYVGIDISKDWLDIAVRPDGKTWCVSGDEAGIESLVDQLKELNPPSL